MIEKTIDASHTQTQKLSLDSRKQLTLNGVCDVEAFSDKEVVLITNMGRLCVKGEKLKISKLNVDTGDFCVSGLICAMIYSKVTQASKGSIFEKMFR